MLYPVVLSGGSGSRLWPISRELYPKQFLPLVSNNTMLQETLLRLQSIEHQTPILICHEEHRFLAAEQLRQIGQLHHNIILEPVGKNTAPAIALAAFTAMRANSDAVLLVLPADHVVTNTNVFTDSIFKAMAHAREGSLLTFGVTPTHPETGYGYIKRGVLDGDAYRVTRFVEKPDAVNANDYIASGDYYWNSGMFLFRADRYLDELRTHRPDIYETCEKSFRAAVHDLDFIRVDKTLFSGCPSVSVDYAVMEKTERAMMMPLDAGWSDIGSWAALADVKVTDAQGNAFHGDVLHYDTSNTYVLAQDALVCTVGVTDTIVVQTKDAVLVVHKDRAQDVKGIVAELKASGRVEHRLHREVYRPWGKYDSVDQGGRYQVKRITVNPGEKLSVQMHHHRAEHWIVVSGTANVTIDENTFLVSENQSVYIPLGAVHALENPGKIPLELIEVQSGAYLGEDDIVRFDDRYGRD